MDREIGGEGIGRGDLGGEGFQGLEFDWKIMTIF
jgi:hypothetical protein